MLVQALAAPPRGNAPIANAEIQEKEVASRIARQRPILRVSAELALVGIIGSDTKSGGEWVMKLMKDLVRCLRLREPV